MVRGDQAAPRTMSAAGNPVSDAAALRRSRRTLLLIALVCLAPVIASFLAYFVFKRDAHTNYGELIAAPAPAFTGHSDTGGAVRLGDFRGRWLIVVAAPADCDASCTLALYATRQARTIQGKERERVARLWLVTDGGAIAPALAAEHPDLAIARVPAPAMAPWPHGGTAIYLVDPLGNLVLAWPRDPDIKALANDLGKLLRASQIG
jgi:hypothetical protein